MSFVKYLFFRFVDPKNCPMTKEQKKKTAIEDDTVIIDVDVGDDDVEVKVPPRGMQCSKDKVEIRDGLSSYIWSKVPTPFVWNTWSENREDMNWTRKVCCTLIIVLSKQFQ